MVMFFFGYEIFPEDGMDNRWNFGVFYIAIACAAQGILFSSVKKWFSSILENQKYKEEYKVGPSGPR